MPTPAFMTLRGERQGLISAGAFTEASVGNVYQAFTRWAVKTGS